MTTGLDWGIARSEVYNAFTPASPVMTREFFFGRLEQIGLVEETIRERGMHAIMFGERGVGKTSMSNILAELFPTRLVVRVPADSGDDFASIWKKVFRRIQLSSERPRPGFAGGTEIDLVSLADAIDVEDLDPDHVTLILDRVV